MRLTVRAPATVANLGPGFDCLALALDVANEFTVDTEAPAAVAVEGEGAGELPEDGTNLVFRTITYLARELGGTLPRSVSRARTRSRSSEGWAPPPPRWSGGSCWRIACSAPP